MAERTTLRSFQLLQNPTDQHLPFSVRRDQINGHRLRMDMAFRCLKIHFFSNFGISAGTEQVGSYITWNKTA